MSGRISYAGLLIYIIQALYGQCRYREALTVLERAEKSGEKIATPLRIHCLLGAGKAQEALELAVTSGEHGWALRARIQLGEQIELDNSELNKYGMAFVVRYLVVSGICLQRRIVAVVSSIIGTTVHWGQGFRDWQIEGRIVWVELLGWSLNRL